MGAADTDNCQATVTRDITKLAGPSNGVCFAASVMVDIYSRHSVGVHVQTRESGLLAVEFMTEIFAVHGIPNVVHADRGTSMTSKPGLGPALRSRGDPLAFAAESLQ